MPWTSKAARSGVGVPSTTGFDHRLFLRRVDLALPKLHKGPTLALKSPGI